MPYCEILADTNIPNHVKEREIPRQTEKNMIGDRYHIMFVEVTYIIIQDTRISLCITI